MILKQKILLIVTFVLILWLGLANVSRLIPESKNYQSYTKALNLYNNGEFSKAYHAFGHVSRFSKLKPAATYRQALCADKTDDPKTEIKKYKEVMRYYPNSLLGLKAKYLNAQYLYETKNYKKARREFKDLLRFHPNSDYAIAANYYLGSMEAYRAKTTKNEKKRIKAKYKAINYFRTYLKEVPDGRFAVNCAEKWLKLNPKPNSEDSLTIAKIYQLNKDYKNAQKYLNYTKPEDSWAYLVKNAYAQKNYGKVKLYTEHGLKFKDEFEVSINKDSGEKAKNADIYQAIDDYIAVNDSKSEAISHLLALSNKGKGYDYLLYRNCNNLPARAQAACFNTLYYQYPEGQFSADALANIFYDKVKSEKYYMAQQIGRKHLQKFPDSNSAPKVMFWLAKVAQRTKNYEEARSYYKRLINQYPDDYYAYHAFLNLNRFRNFDVLDLRNKPVEFPYKNSGYVIVKELAKVKDYGLINQLYPDDDFIQSWLAYLQGNYTNSARIARDGMDKLTYKPDRTDPRWTLVYPIHYYNEIKKYSHNWGNDPTLILSIIREESYFNPNAKSPVGACGLMQLMPTTAQEAGNAIGMSIPNNQFLLNPDTNIRLGNIYYSKLKSALLGKDILAVLAYNGGLGSVSRWRENLNYVDVDDFIEQIPYAETQNYLKKVYRSYWNYIRIYDAVRF